MSEKKWYVVYVGDQKRVSLLPLALNSVSNDFAIWVPEKYVLLRSKGKLKEVSRYLFPGYAFINFDFGKGEAESVVKNTCGGYFLRNPGSKYPTTISDETIHSLKEASEEHRKPKSVAERFHLTEGQKVEISSGPLIGHNGVVIQLKKEKVLVEITIFDRSVKAEIDPSYCHPIK